MKINRAVISFGLLRKWREVSTQVEFGVGPIQGGKCHLGFFYLSFISMFSEESGSKLWLHQESHQLVMIHLEYIIIIASTEFKYDHQKMVIYNLDFLNSCTSCNWLRWTVDFSLIPYDTSSVATACCYSPSPLRYTTPSPDLRPTQ